ncbi:MAG: FeoA family protein [Bacteroidota bacterium]
MPDLSKCPSNQDFEIERITQSDLTPKLTEMGLYPGKKIKVLFRAPFGDPIAIDVEGYTLSLRRTEASLIQVR